MSAHPKIDDFDFEDVLRNALALPEFIYLYGDFFSDPAQFAPWINRLPPQLAQVSTKRQRTFIAGRCCAAQALTKAGFLAPIWLDMDVDHLPCWPEGWLGSISHAGEGAWAAVARRASCAALGIDMECLVDDQTIPEIQRQIATPNELEVLSSLPRPQALTLLFSAKEALYKALYPSMRQVLDFSAAHAVSLRCNTLVLRLSQDWGTSRPAGTDIPINYVFWQRYVFTAACLPRRHL